MFLKKFQKHIRHFMPDVMAIDLKKVIVEIIEFAALLKFVI